MKEYNISALITIMMNAFADSQINTGSILLQTVASYPNVNVDVDGKMISNELNDNMADSGTITATEEQ